MNVLQLLGKDVDESKSIGSNIEAVFLDDLAHLVFVAESVRMLLEDAGKYAPDPETWNRAMGLRLHQLRCAMKPLLEEAV